MALVFFSEFCKISKNTFFFTEHLLTDDWLQNFRKHVALVSQPSTQLIQQGCLTITRIKNYMQFDVTTIFMLSLLPFRVFFPTHFKPRLFSQYTSPSRKPLARPVDPLKKKKIFGIPIQRPGCHLSSQEPTTEVLQSKSSGHNYTLLQKLLYTSRTIKVTSTTLMPHTLGRTEKQYTIG